MAETPLSLQAHISEQRKSLEAAKSTVAQKQLEIKAIQAEVAKFTQRHQIRRKLDLKEKIEELQREISNIHDGHSIQEFEERVKPFLQEQERCKDVFRMEDRLGKKVDNIVSKKRGSSVSGNAPLMSFMRKKART